jgi:Na+/proline symporter/CheY-like chemotaxis protein
MAIWIALATAILYCAGLFLLAHAGDLGRMRWSDRRMGWIYGLSLAVYCTSWTFYGAVGSAIATGWQFLPIYLGPILLFTLGYPIVRRVLRIGKAQHSTSIADFLSARYGKSASIAALVTVIATIGALPYIALQLKSVGETLLALSPDIAATFRTDDVVLAVTAAMAVFAVLFGTSRIDLTQHNRGMVLVIALEAAIKLLALCAVAIFAAILLYAEPSAVARAAPAPIFSLSQIDMRFAVLVLIAACAALCLPRQFHMTVVEAQTDRPDRAMRWVFPAYLLLTSLAVFPIAMAGVALFPQGSVSPDMTVLALPLRFDADWLAIFAFIGGFSAATGMIIVATIALSSMITNDIIVPLAYRGRMRRGRRDIPLGPALLRIRRATIAALLALAFLYYRSIDEATLLAGLGVLSFAAAAQFAPGLVAGLYWRGANRIGMIVGLVAGFAAWLTLLFVPAYLDAPPPVIIGDDILVSGVLISLGANVALLLLFSMFGEANLVDRTQAAAFVSSRPSPAGAARLSTKARVADLRLLLAEIAGPERSRTAIDALRVSSARPYADSDPADADIAALVERQISGILGASSARALVVSTLEGDPLALEDVVAMFGETSQRLQFSADTLEIAIENIDQGVSLVDRDLRLTAWNSRYVEMFGYPDELVTAGRPIADLIRFNLRKAGLDGAECERQIERRIAHLRAGRRHSAESEQPDGRYLRIQGRPAPNGGYVTSYTDITADRLAELALEAKIAERTQQLVAANEALERATRSKTRFLAAASHDLVQPMNAARLFSSALAEEIGGEKGFEKTKARELLERIDRSIGSADQLLRALLDISKLDGGGLEPRPTRFPINDLIEEIESEFAARAEAKGLRFRAVRSSAWVETDRGLLLSIFQNLTANAVRYTDSGGVLVGCRRRAGGIAITVADTGIGIPEDNQAQIFDEFSRFAGERGANGLGLGLAIVRRIADLLDVDVAVQSVEGRGSCFSLVLPAQFEAAKPPPAAMTASPAPAALADMRVLCIDNDPAAREAILALFERWGVDCEIAAGQADAVGKAQPDLVVIDYRLDDGLTGDSLYETLCAAWRARPPVILLTAEDGALTEAAAAAIGAERLLKPVPAAVLRALLSRLVAERAIA